MPVNRSKYSIMVFELSSRNTARQSAGITSGLLQAKLVGVQMKVMLPELVIHPGELRFQGGRDVIVKEAVDGDVWKGLGRLVGDACRRGSGQQLFVVHVLHTPAGL
jgi:hypothetical protein